MTYDERVAAYLRRLRDEGGFYVSRPGAGQTPGPHAASHQNGGSDEVATATAAANAIPKAGSDGALAQGWGPVYATYTPTWSSTGTAPVLNNGTLTGRVWKFGKLCHVTITLLMGSTTTFGTGTYSWELPSVPASTGSMTQAIVIGAARALDAGTANYNGIVQATTSAGTSPAKVRVMNPGLTTFWANNSPFTFASTDEIYIIVTYEEA
jgi:hypothetical protein